MQAVVKTPRINIQITGKIPKRLLSVLKEEYGDRVRVSEDDHPETVSIFETEWYQDVKSKTTRGDNLRIYRKNVGMTQARLGEMLGGIPRQHISNMERGTRSISVKTARKLASLFNVSSEKFL